MHPDPGSEFPDGDAVRFEVFLQLCHAATLHYVQQRVKTIRAPRAIPYTRELCEIAGMSLRDIRTERGLSLAALGEMIGRDASTVQRAETMHRSAKLETFVQCAEVLGVRLEDLFTDRSDLERLIVDAFRSLPADRQQGWADMARAILAEPRAK